eukprot:1015598-Pelagomonas_calceolata.AAC.2
MQTATRHHFFTPVLFSSALLSGCLLPPEDACLVRGASMLLAAIATEFNSKTSKIVIREASLQPLTLLNVFIKLLVSAAERGSLLMTAQRKDVAFGEPGVAKPVVNPKQSTTQSGAPAYLGPLGLAFGYGPLCT